MSVHCGEAVIWNSDNPPDPFDFGYAITVHKAQGSQWPNVMVFDESEVFEQDAKRWLYTALTRASNTVTVLTRCSGSGVPQPHFVAGRRQSHVRSPP
jgi:superfamily I DNA/RNA helicase